MKIYTILLAAFLITGLGCVSQTNTTKAPPAGNTAGNTVEVDIEGLSFVPSSIQINAGQTLHFVNNSGFAHDVHVTKNGADFFPRTQINAGSSLDVTITEAGTYALICDRHAPGMAGNIEAN